MIAQEMVQALEAAGFKDVQIESSAVSQSPYDYVYVYLTPAGPEGPYIVISDADEFGFEKGIYISRMRHYEDAHFDTDTVATEAEAVARAKELAA